MPCIVCQAMGGVQPLPGGVSRHPVGTEGFYTEALRLCQGEGKHPPCAPVGFSFSLPARHARESRRFHGGNCPLRRKLNDPAVELSLFEKHQYNGKLAQPLGVGSAMDLCFIRKAQHLHVRPGKQRVHFTEFRVPHAVRRGARPPRRTRRTLYVR